MIVFHHPPGVFDDSGGSIHGRSCQVDPNEKLRDVRDDFEKSLNPKLR